MVPERPQVGACVGEQDLGVRDGMAIHIRFVRQQYGLLERIHVSRQLPRIGWGQTSGGVRSGPSECAAEAPGARAGDAGTRDTRATHLGDELRFVFALLKALHDILHRSDRGGERLDR